MELPLERKSEREVLLHELKHVKNCYQNEVYQKEGKIFFKTTRDDAMRYLQKESSKTQSSST